MAAALVGIAAAVLASGEIPRLAMNGTRAGALAVMSPIGNFPIRVAAGETILCIGDSNTRGHGKARGVAAFPAVLQRELGGTVRVENLGLGGETAPGGLARVPAAHDRPGLAIVMYGTNDADARGLLSRREAVPLDAFREALQAMIVRYRAAGAQVLVLAPLPAGSPAIDRRVEPYRQAAREVALSLGVHFLDPAQAFAESEGAVLLAYDAVHLNAAGQRALGEWLARHVMVEGEA